MSRLKVMLFCVVLPLLLVACNPTAAEPTPVPPAPTQAPTAAPVAGQAFVESIELLMMESMPIQINAILSGSLSDGCTRIDQISQSRSGNLFTITVDASRPADMVCTEALVPFEEIVSLDVAGLPAGNYTVQAGEVRQGFVFSVDNTVAAVEPEEPELPEATPIPVVGSLRGDVVRGVDRAAIAGLAVQLVSGACPEEPVSADMAVAQAVTGADGGWQFETLENGAYCVVIDALDRPNPPLLLPGRWASDSRDNTTLTVPVAVAGETAAPAIVWNHTFLPAAEAPRVANCIDLAAFSADVTIPDDTLMQPGERFVKSWRLINAGGCPWTPNYTLRFTGGEQMGWIDAMPINQLVVSGDSMDISVVLTAPDTPGTWRGDWQLVNADGNPVTMTSEAEQTVWLQIQTVDSAQIGRISGFVWDDRCDSSAWTFGTGTPIPPGCILNQANGTVYGDGVYDPDHDARLAGVIVVIGRGVCGETIDLASVATLNDGTYQFNGLLPDTYCVYLDLFRPENNFLLPGFTTFPGLGRISTTVVLEAGSEFNNINFAWDFAEGQE